MAQRAVRIWSTQSWDGGLNLRDDAFQLQPNELSDCENVVILPQGGIERRAAYTTFDDGSLTDPRNIWQFLGNGVKQVVVQRTNDVAYAAADGVFTAWNPDALTTSGIMRAATMATLTGAGALNVNDESLYIQRNAEQVGLRFRGSGASSAVLADAAAAFNDNLSAPAGGRLPVARYIATHLNYLWHAYTVEGGNTYKNRVRWSHPGEPEDYRTNDYIDIDSGVDGDEIVGLASFGDRMLVFKKRSIYTISGFSPETFEVFPVVQGIGAASQEAISVSRFGCAFYDPMLGVFLLGRDGNPQWLWDKFQTKIKDGTVQNAYASKVSVCWLDDRLFVSVPWEAPNTVNSRTFVFDPDVGKGGAWYVYTYGIGPMLDFRPTDATQLHLGIRPGAAVIHEIDAAPTAAADESQGVNIPFDSTFTTAWYDVGQPGITKRWRRPSIILDDDYAQTLNLKVYTDYDVNNASREFNLSVDPQSGGFQWGDPWGEPWGGGADGGQSIVRGTGLGRANAVRLKVTAAPERIFTTVLPTAATSGTVYGLDAVYATARDTPFLADTTFLAVGQSFSGGFYVCNEGFLSFDTSAIPSNARIVRATLNVTINTDGSATNFTVYAYRTIYGALTTADYKNQALLALATPQASFDTANIVAGQPLALALDVSNPESYPVLRGGTTDIFLWSSRHESGTAPVGDESLTLDIPTASLEIAYAIDAPWGLNNIDFRYIPQKVR